ncbi:MAG: histidinol-phosphate transaminase [Spirochaetales bacterium]|uniref:Aminotransferase n=1 Tax=Candidatus Thalassospirochaeta sargassi TaxID=3119039 RepID=A0AAJ1MLG4_9SPIO|nr:histidinol-phosphate transaminase [Spirochaetales bacterium]
MTGGLFRRLDSLQAPVHGGTPLPENVVDFSISINPFPIPEAVRKAYISAWDEIGRYPDNDNSSLSEAVSEYFSIAPERLLMTSGATEAFSLLASAFLGTNTTAMVVSPCYSDYEWVSKLAGARICRCSLKPEQSFIPDKKELLGNISENRPDLIWLCSPNNPTGTVFDTELTLSIADTLRFYGGTLIIDEAYAAFSEALPLSETLPHLSNVVFVRSLTKDFGIPGLRLGCINAESDVIRKLSLLKPGWSVSRPAQEAGIVLFTEIEYFKESWRKVSLMKKDLVEAMLGLKLDIPASSGVDSGNFVFFKSPRMPDGKSFSEAMLDAGVRIRDCSSMGAPGFCRIGVRLPDENRHFLEVIERVLVGRRNNDC